MQYLIASFSHKNTDLHLRERIGFPDGEQKFQGLSVLRTDESVNEAVILSTCNRVEVFVSTSNPAKASRTIFSLLHNHSGISVEELEGRADLYEDEGAIHHLFTVCASLDSLVVGETQIAGQLKEAFRFSQENGFAGPKISRAIQYAFKCAADVRMQTGISKNPVSVASTAVAMAKELLGGNLGGFTALVVGAGEMSNITARHLVTSGCNVILFNRNVTHAQQVAGEIGTMVVAKPLDLLPEFINRYRLLFSATGAPGYVIDALIVQKAGFDRHWFDLAVPQDIAPLEDASIHTYAVDDLRQIVEANINLRREQSARAFEIIGRHTIEYFQWMQKLMVEPLIKEIREQAKTAALGEIERALKKGFIDPSSRDNVTKLVHNAFNKFLHRPTVRIKEMADQPKAENMFESMKHLFDLEAEVKVLKGSQRESKKR